MTLVAIYEVEMVPVLRSRSQIRRRAVKTGKCEMEWYFDPNIGENGRCQPCGEICDPSWGTQDQCLANIDQCEGKIFLFYEKMRSVVCKTKGRFGIGTHAVSVVACKIIENLIRGVFSEQDQVLSHDSVIW